MSKQKTPKSIGSMISGMLLNEAKNMTRLEARSFVKKSVFSGVKNFFNKSEEDLIEELTKKIGYQTTHYKLGKNSTIEFKVSPPAIHEWLEKSRTTKGKIVLNEETNSLFYEDIEITNKLKLELISKIAEETGASAHAIHRAFDGAIKYFGFTDHFSLRFAKHFDGWNPSSNSVIDRFIPELFGEGVDTDLQYINPLFKKWIIGTAKRAMNPGELLDGCFVLTGPSGVGKTQFFRQLLPPPFEHRTGEIACDIRQARPFVESIVGKTIACFDELSHLEIKGKVEETFKMIISNQNVDVRLAWRRDAERYALRQGFCATTNEKQFIRDRGISRRMWVLELNGNQRLDFDRLHELREGLWKEAVYLAKQDERTYLSPDEQKEVDKMNEKYFRKGY